MLARIFAVIAASFLVGSVAIGTLAPPDMSLGEALNSVSRFQISAVETFVRLHLSDWIWDKPLRALLVRPIWLMPAACGLICAGAAMTAASRQKAAPSRRRRS